MIWGENPPFKETLIWCIIGSNINSTNLAFRSACSPSERMLADLGDLNLYRLICHWITGKGAQRKGDRCTFQGTNISHLGNRKIIFKMPFWGYVSSLEGKITKCQLLPSVTFWSPKWRSLNPWKRPLKSTKRVTWKNLVLIDDQWSIIKIQYFDKTGFFLAESIFKSMETCNLHFLGVITHILRD